MAVSAAKLEANRRNAERSTGPRTEVGKQQSSQNAVTHGLRAKTLVLLDEDPQVLEDRRAAWRACLVPGDDVEERLVDAAVVHTWMQDRARRAQAARLNADLALFGVAQAVAEEQEVEELGQRLFKDRMGPLTFYPTADSVGRDSFSRNLSTSYAGDRKDDPDPPAAIILRLQSTLTGCEWLLGEWARLQAIIKKGQAWLSSDKLKAIRLLGKQPFDAIDERDVAMVLLAAFVLKPEKSAWHWEIAVELSPKDLRRFQASADTRQLESLTPENATSAREALMEIIERATDRLTKKAEVHRTRARTIEALAPDLMAFDESTAGERLRSFELASGRGLSRSLEDLRKHRRDPLSVVRGPLSVVSANAEAITGSVASNEPTVAGENVTNEPNVGPLSVVRGPLPVVSCNVDGVDATNVTNEPTVGPLSVVSSPLSVVSGPLSVVSGTAKAMTDAIAPNEPNGAGENVTNEPTAGPLSVVSGPLPVVRCNVDGVDATKATNKPTGGGENVTNEPTGPRKKAPNALELAVDCKDAEWTEADAGIDEGGDDFKSRAYEEELGAQMRQALRKHRKPMGMHELVEFIEERKKEVERVMAERRARRGEQRKKNGKSKGQAKDQAASRERKARLPVG